MATRKAEDLLAAGLEAVRQYERDFEAKLLDPVKQQAWELVQAGEELFWQKEYDAGIQKLEAAADLDPSYREKVEAYRRTKLRELRKGRVNLTRAANRILFPRLLKLGIRLQFERDGRRWKAGSSLVWEGPGGQHGAVLMGADKFGKQFGLNVGRDLGAGTWESLDLRTVGLGPDALSYLNQAEADAVLERVAIAFEGPIRRWLEGSSI